MAWSDVHLDQGFSASVLLAFGARQFFVWGGQGALCIGRGLAAFLARTTLPSCDKQQYLQTLSQILWGTKAPPDETGLNKALSAHYEESFW